MIQHETAGGKEVVKIELAEEVTFINKAPISYELESLPENSEVEIDVTTSIFLDNDIVEILDDFLETSEEKKIATRLVSEKGIEENPKDIAKILELY